MAEIIDLERISHYKENTQWQIESQKYRDDLLTADKRRGEAFKLWAEDLSHRGLYESAYGAYSKALDSFLSMGVACDFMTYLDARAMMSMKIGAYKFALRDGMEMIYTDPRHPLGYIRAGKAYEALADFGRAVEIYSEGVKFADPNHSLSKSLDLIRKSSRYWDESERAMSRRPEDSSGGMLSMTSYVTSVLRRLINLPPDPNRMYEWLDDNGGDSSNNSQVRDPLHVFPPELLARILDEIPVVKWNKLLRVSRSWAQMVNSSRWSSHVLAIVDHKWPITVEKFAEYLKKSNGCISDIILENVSYKDCDSCAQLLLYGYSAQYKVLALSRHDVENLRALTLRFCTCMFKMWMLVPNVDWMLVTQLEELRVRMENAPEVIYLLADGRLPNLRVLECRGIYDIVDAAEDILLLNDNRTYTQQSQLKVLYLGGPMPEKPIYPYIQKTHDYRLSQRSLERLLSLLPELEELRCININTIDGSPVVSGIQQRRPRLDLMVLTPKLKIVDFSWSKLSPTPLISPSCEELSTNFCQTGLRHCYSELGSRFYVDMFDVEDLDIDAEAETGIDQNEYRNLQRLSIAKCAMPAFEIIDVLARCDPQKLTQLNLHGCPKVDFAGKLPTHSSDFLSHAESYHSFNSTDLRPASKIAQLIVVMFPNLKRLFIGYNPTVNDSTLRACRSLPHLQYLDVSHTSISDSGVEDLLLYSVRVNGRQVERLSYLTETHGDLTQTNIKTMVVTGCSNVTDTSEAWAAVGCNLKREDYSFGFMERYVEFLGQEYSIVTLNSLTSSRMAAASYA